ncbi:Flagellar motility protein MotE, a chaperone for MotC folding [Cohaesibacter sp. ES.047]|uniref:MotE family protein n=1 Tax=Cohaesibacter sp. ES.047 TaxID=1798205 RepID=UPI000BC01572|nr:MotE family protein [Cohaesibacter sp. ES.047]SNY92175.1 Flagellar motility protein MotE, a chaperone for MotC folding [Cohaesibacter sp. ES.047]
MISLSGWLTPAHRNNRLMQTGLVFGLCMAAAVVSAAPAPSNKSDVASKVATAASDVNQSDARSYCANIADAAREQRIAWQLHNLVALQADIDERTQKLEALRTDVRAWIEKRDRILGEVKEHIVSVYERMRPDAAAESLARLDNDVAIGLLTGMQPRVVGSILNEMEADRASSLTEGMASLVELDKGELADD